LIFRGIESTLIEIKTHEKKVKKYEEKAKVSAATAEKLAYPIDSFEDPEVKLTKKTEQEVKKSGTKLQKLMLKIREEKDLKIAIDLL
jgi:hypothetical protein